MIKRSIPVAIAVAVGLLTFIGLLLNLPQLSRLLLTWASFLAAVALLVGVLNLFGVHANRLLKGNGYSGVLALSMAAVFVLAITDWRGITTDGVSTVFNWVQFPLEAALSSLLAFLLLFAGAQLLRRQRNIGGVLFLLTALLVLLSTALATSRFIPGRLAETFGAVREVITTIFVTAGMRGILLGVALGTITLGIRLLVGVERPYNK
ncbi:MAG: hypothetical protein H6662_11750 [Ardenticatenaceae bacterium]|nr:hypothetical protein [Anaerolineales bacterium]MCB8922249.1 hypothetical protein [Ardenticatenaceae bacterium]MCB8990566.1 hypothetical protein [Ardenticatenaceae bacterium]